MTQFKKTNAPKPEINNKKTLNPSNKFKELSRLSNQISEVNSDRFKSVLN